MHWYFACNVCVRVSDPLEPELQTAVNCQAGSWNWTQVLLKTRYCSYRWAISPAPGFLFYKEETRNGIKSSVSDWRAECFEFGLSKTQVRTFLALGVQAMLNWIDRETRKIALSPWPLAICFLSSVFWDRVSLCKSPGCPGTHYVDQDGLKLTEICLPLPPECWD